MPWTNSVPNLSEIVQSAGELSQFEICECMLFFLAAQGNLALNKPAVQFSTYANWVASMAVDGNDYTASCTDNGWNNPWWSVDLGAPYDVHQVIVTNDVHPSYGNCGRTYCIDSL